MHILNSMHLVGLSDDLANYLNGMLGSCTTPCLDFV